ncbi:MAG: AAA family ATPase, partial [Candidatus Lokiarchaeota archaeon]|nr:AAA family ATPase [Candidatus Lokiarchaeota archaeon]
MAKKPKRFVKNLTLKNVYGIFNSEIEFFRDINVLYGVNGSGKTTILHILANILDENFFRFVYLNFDEIKIEFNSREFIRIVKENKEFNKSENIPINSDMLIFLNKNQKFQFNIDLFNDDLEKDFLKEYESISFDILSEFKTAYFPAFRNMIEAWVVRDLDKYERKYRTSGINRRGEVLYYNRLFHHVPGVEALTVFARRLFGEFIPNINYPSVMEIENELNNRIIRTYHTFAQKNEILYYNTLVKIFSKLIPVEEE